MKNFDGLSLQQLSQIFNTLPPNNGAPILSAGEAVLDAQSIKNILNFGDFQSYHDFEIVRGSNIYVRDGRAPHIFERLLEANGISTHQLSGLRVLDIGAFTGAYSFGAEDLGATVVSLDVIAPESCGFSAIHKIRRSRCTHIMASVYDLQPEVFGLFDLVIFMGVIYHLKHPLLALERINSVMKTGARVIIGSTSADRWLHTEDDQTFLKGLNLGQTLLSNSVDGRATELPLSGFYADSYLGDKTNWFIPNQTCLEGWARSSGLEVTSTRTSNRPVAASLGRPELERSITVIVGRKHSDPAPEYYDTMYSRHRKTDNVSANYQYNIPTSFDAKNR